VIRRAVPLLLLASALLGATACRRRPAPAIKPTTLSEPVAEPLERPRPSAPAPAQRQALAPVAVVAASAAAAKPDAALRKPAPAPSVANPYQPASTPGRLPMWKQRAKFY
jgi:hypothetical protein